MIPMEPVDLNSMVTNPHGLKELDIKENPRDDRSFLDRNHWPSPSRGGYPGKGPCEIVDPGANVEEIFSHHQPDSQKVSDADSKQQLTSCLSLSS
jgi:hypothetical protein